MQNNTLPYNELQQVARNLRLPCGWERRLESRVKRLRAPANMWFFGFGCGFVTCCLIAIHVAQLVG